MSDLSIQAPNGAHFEIEEVRTNKGTKSLGQVPILVWDDLEGLTEHVGAQGVLDACDGTSFRVAYQSIARRQAAAEKTMDEIGQAQIDYRPGKRQAATPASKAARAAKAATEAGVDADQLQAFLEKVARGEVDLSTLG